jgi:hypothetical protein
MSESTPAKPPHGARCQEASPLSHQFYIACGQPAEYVVKNRDPDPYAMCAACAVHNVRNRGARYVLASETFTIATIEGGR